MANPIVEGFSVAGASILDGTTGAEVANGGDIYGVRSGSVELETDTYDNTGDDAILSTWNWFTAANLSIQSGYMSFQTYSLITGSKVTSSGSGATQTFSLPLWEDRQNNIQPLPVLIRVPSKDADGVARRLDIVLYKVQFQPIAFEGPSYKEGLLVNYNGRALVSTKDEKGAQVVDSVTGLPSKAIGRILSAAPL